MVAQNAFSVANEGPCLFLVAQFQTYAVLNYLLYDNVHGRRKDFFQGGH